MSVLIYIFMQESQKQKQNWILPLDLLQDSNNSNCAHSYNCHLFSKSSINTAEELHLKRKRQLINIYIASLSQYIIIPYHREGMGFGAASHLSYNTHTLTQLTTSPSLSLFLMLLP